MREINPYRCSLLQVLEEIKRFSYFIKPLYHYQKEWKNSIVLWQCQYQFFGPCTMTIFFNILHLTRMPTLMLWESIWARRSLLTRFCPKNFLRNLVLYFRLSPHTPHCQASRCCRPGESSQVQRSMRPELHALASAWDKAAEDTASRKAVSLKPDEMMQLLMSTVQNCYDYCTLSALKSFTLK